MLSATSNIGLEFLTKFLNMSKLQNRLILLYQSLPLQRPSIFNKSKLQRMSAYFRVSFVGSNTQLELAALMLNKPGPAQVGALSQK